MATIREIRRRITAVKSTRKITRAMQLVAAAKLRRAQENILKLRPYALRFEQVMAQVAVWTSSDIHPLLAPPHRSGFPSSPQAHEHPTGTPAENVRNRRFLLILVTGDQGLSGGFNANVIRAARSYIAEHEGCERLDLYCVGRKGRDFFMKTKHTPVGQKVNFFNRLKFADAAQIVSDITRLFFGGGYDRVDILYNEFGSAIHQVLTVKQFLPFVPVKPAGPGPSREHTTGTMTESRPAAVYLYEPDERTVLGALIPRNLEVQMWRVMLESYAAEMGAKMTAMDAATENADKFLATLSVSYNRARQAQITKELTEIVGGAESLGG